MKCSLSTDFFFYWYLHRIYVAFTRFTSRFVALRGLRRIYVALAVAVAAAVAVAVAVEISQSRLMSSGIDAARSRELKFANFL